MEKKAESTTMNVPSAKCFSAVLISLLLVSVFASGSTESVNTAVIEPVKLYAITTSEPYFGHYGGYRDIWYAIKTELIKIGIDLQIVTKTNDQWYTTVWNEPTWNRTGDWNGDSDHTNGVDGWDLTICEWWLNPTSYVWLDALVYSWMTPPSGYNFMSWSNPKIDILWQRAQTQLDPSRHKQYMWLWQEEFMHNPPATILYYADLMTARAAYVDGYDDTAWLHDLSQLDINETLFDQVAPATRKTIGSNTLICAAENPIYNCFPSGVNTRTEEAMSVLKAGMLYRTSRENMMFPPSGGFTVKPTLATDFPTWRQIEEGGQQKWVARVPIKSGLTWTDGVPFNATDVAYTYNLMLSGVCYAYCDYWFLLDRAEVVDAYTVDFIYKPGIGPDYDFAGYNAHGWGIGPVPWHQLKDEHVTPTNWRSLKWNTDPIPASRGGEGLECLGPYLPIEYVKNDHIKLELRPEYVNALGWATTLPQYFILKTNGNALQRWNALNNLEADLIEYPPKPLGDWLSMNSSGKHKVYSYHYPASNPLWINLQNPVLSNRYVRLAIAHAIPYPKIFNDILPGWGVSKAYPGKTWILPWHESFSTALGNYEYNIDKAKQYMDMWRYSQASMDPSKGPRGDHDFSGYVDIVDYAIWANCFGTTQKEWRFAAGNDVDADNDNNDCVDMSDYPPWAANFGKHYPFNGAW